MPSERCDEMTETDWMAERFEQHRTRLRAVAYRILGSPAEADDAVQEAWIRFSRADTDDVDNLGAWLTTVVSRVCLNMLQARRSRPQPALDPDALDEPAADEPGPEAQAVLADSIGLALLVVLDTLPPAERVAFVLHDVFAVPFDDIAPIVERSTPATRQLASRARARVQRRETGPEADRVRQAELVDAFLAAARQGEFDRLVSLLDPDVVLRADPHAAALGMAPVTRGAREVAGFGRLARGATPALLSGEPGAAWVHAGQLRVLYAFTIEGDRITAIDLIGDPARFAGVEVMPQGR
jgi:RNA polymerase sigma-70 factor (ECF subfamily)